MKFDAVILNNIEQVEDQIYACMWRMGDILKLKNYNVNKFNYMSERLNILLEHRHVMKTQVQQHHKHSKDWKGYRELVNKIDMWEYLVCVASSDVQELQNDCMCMDD